MIPEWLRQRCLLCSATVLLSVCHLPNTCKDRCLCSTGINSEGIIGDVSPKNIRVGYNYRETSRNWHKKVSPISRNVFILVFSVIKYKIWVFLSYGLDSQEWWFLAIIVHLAHLIAQLVLDWLRDTTGICLLSVCEMLMLLLNRLSVHNWNARCHRTWPQFSTAPACWCGSACMCVIKQHSVSCVYLMHVFVRRRVYIWASVCLSVWVFSWLSSSLTSFSVRTKTTPWFHRRRWRMHLATVRSSTSRLADMRRGDFWPTCLFTISQLTCLIYSLFIGLYIDYTACVIGLFIFIADWYMFMHDWPVVCAVEAGLFLMFIYDNARHLLPHLNVLMPSARAGGCSNIASLKSSHS